MKTLVGELEKIIEQAQWPMEHQMTMKSRRIYEEGLDIVNSYRGHPAVFLDGLNAFQATRSTPYAYAGIAFTLTVAASGEDTSKAIKQGLEKAMHWLEKSQYLEPDRLEINFIEATIYMYGKDLRNSRVVLDYLNQQDSRNNYYVCLTEMNYWRKRGLKQQYFQWFQQAMKTADNNRRQAFVLNSLANFYLENRMYEKSIKAFQKVVKLDPNDPWAWHNMSLMFLDMKQLKEAGQCNKVALSIMDFGAARQIEQEIKKNRGIFGRLFSK